MFVFIKNVVICFRAWISAISNELLFNLVNKAY